MGSKRAAATAALVGMLALGAWAETVIKQGTVIKVVLDTPVNSATSKAGDKFTLHCAEEDCGGFPEGTKFHGKLVTVQPKKEKHPGSVDVTVDHAELPGGKTLNIAALPATKKGKVRESLSGSTGKKDLKKKTQAGGFVGNLIIGPAATVAGLAANKVVPPKPEELSAKPGQKGYIKMMEPVKLK
jgi:hypothetical protein